MRENREVMLTLLDQEQMCNKNIAFPDDRSFPTGRPEIGKRGIRTFQNRVLLRVIGECILPNE